MRRTLLALGLALAVTLPSYSAAQQDLAAKPVTLDAAVRMAERNSPITTAARGATRVGRATVTNALSQFLPFLSLGANARHSAGATYFQGKLVPFQGDAWSYSKQYNASMTLFGGGQRWFNYRAAQATLSANSANEILQRFNVALAVKQQYFAVLAARETEAAGIKAQETAQTQLDIATARYHAGAGSRLDSLHAAVAVGQARLTIINAQNSLRAADADLTRLVGSNDVVTAYASDTSEVPIINADSIALANLASQGPAVSQATAAYASARASRRAAMTSYLPTLSMSYGGGSSKTSPTFAVDGAYPSTSTGYGFSLTWTVFNNFNREFNLALASANEDDAAATLRDARLGARENLINYLDQFRTAMETIELQRLQIAAAEEDLAGQQERYRLGAGTLLDVTTAQSALDTARLALITARFQARTAKAQIETVVGKDLP